MKCIVTLGHNGSILLDGENHRSAVFHPGRRTLTGARHRDGTLRCDTTASVQRYLGIRGKLKSVKDKIEVPNDKGIFNEINAVDVYQNAKRCYYIVSVPLTVLAGACKLIGEK